MDTIRKENINPNDIHTVILAGGSSLWPFVYDIIEKELRIERKHIKRSDRPYAAIAEGLALLPALREKFALTKEKLEKERPELVESLKKLVAERFETICEVIGEVVVHDLFDCKLREIIKSFRGTGGSVASLKKELVSATAGAEGMLKEAVSKAMSTRMQSLPLDVKNEVNIWFEKHGLASPEDDLATPRMNSSSATASSPTLFAWFNSTIQMLTVTIASVLVASICGGGGTALIASGPIGWLIGLVLGVAATVLMLKLGRKQTSIIAESIPIHPKLLTLVLSDSKLKKARQKIYKEVVEKVRAQCKTVQADLTSQVETIVTEQIEALRDIDWMRK